MSWETNLVLAVRTLVNDLGSTQQFSDSTIERAIVVGGLMVANEYNFSTDYTFDLSTPDLSPDPTDTDTLDNIANALFILKASCILNINSYQGAISGGTIGIRVKEAESEIDTTGSTKGYDSILKNGPCMSYQNMLHKLTTDKSMGLGQAILTPYSDGTSEYTRAGANGIWNIRNFFDNFWG